MTSNPTGRRSAVVAATVVAAMLSFFAPQLAAQQAARPSVFMVPNVAAGPEIPATKAAVWGPAECYNQVQDVNEDGVDCCEDGGIPACSCAFQCG